MFTKNFTKNLVSKNILNRLPRVNYSDKVVKHYEKPQNVGSFDKNDKNVGTGLVGSPACFHQDTVIAVPDIRNNIVDEDLLSFETMKEIYQRSDEGRQIIQVWSYNLSTKAFEIKNARIILTGRKYMHKIILDNNTSIIVTPEHQFLTKEQDENGNITYVYKTNLDIFKQQTEIIGNRNLTYKITGIEQLDDVGCDAYTFQVEENNNYCIVVKNVSNLFIVVKNCGDVLKLQIKVNDGGKIIDTCCKAFGCASAIASSSLASEMVKNQTIDIAQGITNKMIATELNLPPVKLHCSMLAEDAIKHAIKDYEKKQKSDGSQIELKDETTPKK